MRWFPSIIPNPRSSDGLRCPLAERETRLIPPARTIIASNLLHARILFLFFREIDPGLTTGLKITPGEPIVSPNAHG